MTALALLATGLLFGGMVLYSFGFAAFLLKNAEAAEAGRLLRAAFPQFYLFVIVAGAAAALLRLPSDGVGALLLGIVAVTTVPARQTLMPAINAASDAGASARFKWLHGASVALGLVQIVLVGWALLRFL
ncbi:hypothetical protein ROJ8625_01916 [Roseivivax jejudonensis]|uniref:TMEM205-like domain-containing protein n=1 Tax=Roseivivax jejudonensis TaxID=1529041 RepID=A0A1X6Z504_9RHOB|nr:DUF4149 domain-containing protein [Roseivivax jejudonensis]SLN40567.1 hypothetical protein ROJ8625_01916 [Roseivivax jejudonensis]